MEQGNLRRSINDPQTAPEPFLAMPPAVYKAQLRIVCGEDREPVPYARYTLSLTDWHKEEGVTDAEGLTHVVTTSLPTGVLRITVMPNTNAPICCGASDDWWKTERRMMDGYPLELAITTLADVAPVTEVALPRATQRRLTRGEIAMARTVFGDGIEYGKVTIHRHGYRLFFGSHENDAAATLCDDIYMPSPDFKYDYSRESDADKHFFIHQMTHVWQYQMGYPCCRTACATSE
jgi:type VI secretion system secreted protein VgrG